MCQGNPDWELKEHLEQWLAELLTNQNFSKASRISEFLEISGLTKPQWPFSLQEFKKFAEFCPAWISQKKMMD